MTIRGLLQRLPPLLLAALVVFAFWVSTAAPSPAKVQASRKADLSKLAEMCPTCGQSSR